MTSYESASAPAGDGRRADIPPLAYDHGARQLENVTFLLDAARGEIEELLGRHYWDQADGHDRHCELCQAVAVEDEDQRTTMWETLDATHTMLRLLVDRVDSSRPWALEDYPDDPPRHRLPAPDDPSYLAAARAAVRAASAAAPAGVAAGLLSVLDERAPGWAFAFLQVSGPDGHRWSLTLPWGVTPDADPAPDAVIFAERNLPGCDR